MSRMRPLFAFALLLISSLASAEHRFPSRNWLMYASPEDAGFSSKSLADARKYWESTQSAALMVVYKGAVVAAWGDVERRFMLHSVRKSLMNGLYGIHVDAGTIDLQRTLKKLEIDDVNPPLNDEEKKARILDLLGARSGVYHQAAAEPPGNPKPPRGSHAPGTHWCYNNWDFNVLGTIIEQEAGIKISEEFEKRFAKPLGMQDYRARDGSYERAPHMSIHPAYPIRMSARDMARFGLLYLRMGSWNGRPILSEDWVCRSTRALSVTQSSHGDYGYLWWIAREKALRKLKMYSALGVGEQSIDVIPGADMVVVHRTNTFAGNQVSGAQRIKLLKMILKAKVSEAKKNPGLVPLAEVPRAWKSAKLSDKQKQALCKKFSITFLGALNTSVDIVLDDGGLVLNTPVGRFGLIALGDNKFILEDIHNGIYAEMNDKRSVTRLRTETELVIEGYRYLQAGEKKKALATFEKAVEYFPYSYNSYDSLGEAFLKAGDMEQAIRNYERSLELNPNNTNAVKMLRRCR